MSSTGNTRKETLAEVWRKLTELKEDAERGARLSFEGVAYYDGLSDAADSVKDMMSNKQKMMIPELLIIENIELTIKLHKLFSRGQGDTPDADEVRERICDILEVLPEHISNRLRNISGDLFELWEKADV
jgi:hypothetical protein